MARIGDRGVYIGSPDWHIGDDLAFAPVSALTPTSAQFAQGDAARVDAGDVYTNDPLGDVLFLEWRIEEAPARSARRLRVAADQRSALVTLDDVGPYFVEMRVYGANGGEGARGTAVLVAQPASSPYDPQQVYSASWLWQYLPDVWSQLPITDRLKVEVFWRGLQQLVASDVMQVLNTRDALSIATIQDRVFRKWLRVDMTLTLPDAPIFAQLPTTHAFTQQTGAPFTTHATLSNSDHLGVIPQLTSGGALVNARTLVLNSYNLQPRDIGKEVTLTGLPQSRSARISALVAVGDRVGATLSAAISVDPPIYPVDVDVTLQMTAARELGAIGTDKGAVELGFTQSPNAFTLRGFAAMPTTGVRGVQVRVPDALARGVRAGDTLEYAVVDVTGREARLFADIIAVSDGFIIVSPRGTVEDALSRLSMHAAEHAAEAATLAWRRRHLGDWLSANDLVEFGVGTARHERFRLRTHAVHRRSATEVSDDVRSLFRLTERTERALVDGQVMITEGLTDVPLSRDIVDLYENLDFQLRAPQDTGDALVSDGTHVVTAGRYDFVRAQVRPGDTLVITSGPHQGEFTIIGVTARSVALDRALSPYPTARFYVRGAATQTLLVLRAPLPEDIRSLWAETAVMSNSKVVDAQIGALVGLRLDEWVARGMTNTYRDAVIGLMYARMTASTLAQIENAVSLIAGIPFAPYRSRIAEIDTEYIGAVDGVGRVARVTLEELLPDGTATQRYSAHVFPAASEEVNDASVGIGFNEREGRRFRVGDVVEQFTALALGVKVHDLYSAPTTYTLDDVRDRHRFRVVIDVDAARVTEATLRFVHDFVIEIKPAYTNLLLMLSKFVADTINIEEDVFFRLRAGFYDNPYHHRGPANIVDDLNPERDRVDMAVTSPLTTWFPRDGVVVFGTNDATLVSALGGFVNPQPRMGVGAAWPQPWIQVGDTVELRQHKLRLIVQEVTSDTSMRLTGVIPVELQRTTRTAQPFIVSRYRTDVIRGVELDTLSSDDALPISVVGTTASDVGVGDTITLTSAEATSLPLRVVHIDRDGDNARLFTYPRRPINALSDVTLRAFREQIVDRVLYTGAMTLLRRVNGLDAIYRTATPLLSLGVEPGDELLVPGHSPRLIACVTPDSVSVAPPLPLGADVSDVRVVRPARNTSGDDQDEHERAVGSAIEVIIKNVAVRHCGAIVRCAVPLRVGDLLYFADESFDHGEGRGVVRVMAVLGGCAYCTGRARTGWTTATIIRQSPLRWMYYTAPSERALYGDWATQHWR